MPRPTTGVMSSEHTGSAEDYRFRRGELSAYGRASNSARALHRLALALTLIVVALAALGVILLPAGSAWSLVTVAAVLALCSILGFGLILYSARKNFIEPDLAFRIWLQQVCDGDLDAKIGLPESHAHYKELHFHTKNLATSLNRLSTDMDTLVENQTRRLEYQNRILDLLYKLTTDVSRENNKQSVLSTVCRYLQDWFDAAATTAYLKDSDPTRALIVSCPDSQSVEKNKTMPKFVRDIEYYLGTDGSSYTIQVPVHHSGSVAGMLVIETANYNPADQDRVEQVLTTIAEQLSLFLSKHSALEQSRTAQMVRDRNALAADIHDSLAQTLAALRYQTTLLKEDLASKSTGELEADVVRIQSTVAEANQEVRGLIQEFRHPLSQRRSAEEIRAKVENFRRSSGMQVFFQIDDPQLSFTPREASQLERIVGEALNNAQKYSQASMVRVYLRSDDMGIRRVLVEDDGIGFNHKEQVAQLAPQTENGGNHIGLSIMQERASSVGATLTIESEPGEGTRVSIELPPHEKFPPHQNFSPAKNFPKNLPENNHE